MSRTDKTKPLKYRVSEPGFTFRETTNTERTLLGRGGSKFYKRLSHKRTRRSPHARTKMSGHGYFEDHYRYLYQD